MPYRLDPKHGEWRTKLQFTTASWMPYKIYEACKATGVLSNTRYCQIAICEKLARDLDMDLDELLANLPRSRTSAAHLFDPVNDDLPGRGEREHHKQTRVAIGRYGMGGADEEIH